jgi:hypothetical protein
MITQSSEACIVYVKPTKELVHHKTGNDAPIYIVFPLQYFDFHLQHPGLSPVIQILFFSFKLVGIGVIDQVSQVHVTSADQGESGGKHNTVS